MRRFMVIPLAALLVVAVASPAAAGPNVSNTSGGGRVVNAEWWESDRYGYLFLAQEKGQPGWGELYEESGTWVECDPSGEPELGPMDTGPGEGDYGFVGTRTYGWADDVAISFSGRLESGTATGRFHLWIETVDDCAGIVDGYEHSELFAVELTGTGSLVTFRGHGSMQVPSEFNGHYIYRGKERAATGSLDLGGSGGPTFGWAYMTEYTWVEHVNS